MDDSQSKDRLESIDDEDDYMDDDVELKPKPPIVTSPKVKAGSNKELLEVQKQKVFKKLDKKMSIFALNHDDFIKQ